LCICIEAKAKHCYENQKILFHFHSLFNVHSFKQTKVKLTCFFLAIYYMFLKKFFIVFNINICTPEELLDSSLV